MKYKADITAGSCKLPESQVVAGLPLQRAPDSRWQSAPKFFAARTGPQTLKSSSMTREEDIMDEIPEPNRLEGRVYSTNGLGGLNTILCSVGPGRH